MDASERLLERKSVISKLLFTLSMNITLQRYRSEVEVTLHTYLTSVMDGRKLSGSRSGRFILRERNVEIHLGRRLGGPPVSVWMRW
jgi:hypothetical protein